MLLVASHHQNMVSCLLLQTDLSDIFIGVLFGNRRVEGAKCICGVPFTGKYAYGNLWRHIKEAERFRDHGPLLCKHCTSTFKRENNLHQHYASSHPQDECSHCGKVFAPSVTLHGTAAKSFSDIRCQICGKSFSKQDDYNRHMESRHRPQHPDLA
jgi:uncharacterized C2H2 Zn-finger protein